MIHDRTDVFTLSTVDTPLQQERPHKNRASRLTQWGRQKDPHSMITVGYSDREHRQGYIDLNEKILSHLQKDNPTDESRLTKLLITMANADFDIS